MRTARSASWSHWLMARTVANDPRLGRHGLAENPLTCAFRIGAGDENRTRTISLGIRTIQAAMRPDLRGGLSASNRERARRYRS